VLENITQAGKLIVERGPQLNVWRAATDNDGLKLFDTVNWGGARLLTDCLKAGYDHIELADAQVATRPTRAGGLEIVIRQRWLCPGAKLLISHVHTYRVTATGIITVGNNFDLDRRLPELPRLGVTLVLPSSLEQIEWYGLGPLENYCDRKRGSVVAHYRSTVTGQYVPYILPQEHGNKCGVRWLALHDGRGHGVRIAAQDRLLEASASHFTAADLYAARHTTDLKPRPEVQVNLDYAQRGLGTASCGPDTLPRYRISAGKYRLTFTLAAVATA
jgi:beta-galactosidase